jgi:hypothetical protein
MNAYQRRRLNEGRASNEVVVWIRESRGRRTQHEYVVKGDDMVPMEDYLKEQELSPAEADLVIRNHIPSFSGST